jgi:hypothetical protein
MMGAVPRSSWEAFLGVPRGEISCVPRDSEELPGTPRDAFEAAFIDRPSTTARALIAMSRAAPRSQPIARTFRIFTYPA